MIDYKKAYKKLVELFERLHCVQNLTHPTTAEVTRQIVDHIIAVKEIEMEEK